MKNIKYHYGRRVAMASVLLLSTALPISGMASEDAATAKVETAGERAHFAQAFCQVSPERIGAYKQQLRNRLPEASDFDRHWQVGWHRANKDNARMSALRDHDPSEFEARIKVNCERLKWLAGNSLRTPARK
ncbi:hypothetical protein [Paraburkholderia fynbosensis]|uniref:Lysozyme inhibitor LprI N-terminal domain-containing protein n=1 Tax=Paraburkholderia fynbosensis TaxID=1200993 RepID=A0A6J5FR32_9BURK|nr:hypothetical protein [Paraburkholderia fynbosensis]CAB3783161.1 hypothetical protein LMG27177_01437 [Paraburkholderia fynbosensis]